MHLFRRVRSFLLVLLMPRLVNWAADALELLGEDMFTLNQLDPWQRAHLLEAASSAARTYGCVAYLMGHGQRLDELEPVR